jgi:hypothetical protein
MAGSDDDDTKKRELKETAHWQTERRDKMAADGLRSLLLLNGGGAVALLAFLQSIWTQADAKRLVPWVLAGMIPLLIGAALGGWIHFVRYDTTMAYQMKGGDGPGMTQWHQFLTKVGFGAFLFGMAIIIVGALCNLPA